MKKLFLSLDWDYFVGASKEDMEDHFPASFVHYSEGVCSDEWRDVYDDHPHLFKVKPRPEYYALLSIVHTAAANKPGVPLFEKLHVCVSHADMYAFILSNLTPEDTCDLLHVDFHHDCFIGMGELDCGNWLRCVKELDKKNAIESVWFAPDGCLESPSGMGEHMKDYLNGIFSRIVTRPKDGAHALEAPDRFFETFEPYMAQGEEVYVFLCRSDQWTPPHLDGYFHDLSKVLNSYSKTTESVFDGAAYGSIRRWKK